MTVKSDQQSPALSPAWRYSALLVFLVGLGVLTYLSASAYNNAPPVPEKVVGPAGEIVFTGDDILAGQSVFLKYALMENGTIWGHGAYLGPDFSAAYLHSLGVYANRALAQKEFGGRWENLHKRQQEMVHQETRDLLKQNRYHAETHTLTFTRIEKDAYLKQIDRWSRYFQGPSTTGGIMQLWDVLSNGYWHARSLDYMNEERVRLLECARMPADLVFIILGVIPALLTAVKTYRYVKGVKGVKGDG